MRGVGWMGVAGFRRVGRVVLGALGPVDVVVRGVGVWRCGGCPGEQELAGVVGGRECFNGSCWRVWVIPGLLLDRFFLRPVRWTGRPPVLRPR